MNFVEEVTSLILVAVTYQLKYLIIPIRVVIQLRHCYVCKLAWPCVWAAKL